MLKSIIINAEMSSSFFTYWFSFNSFVLLPFVNRGWDWWMPDCVQILRSRNKEWLINGDMHSCEVSYTNSITIQRLPVTVDSVRRANVGSPKTGVSYGKTFTRIQSSTHKNKQNGKAFAKHVGQKGRLSRRMEKLWRHLKREKSNVSIKFAYKDYEG